MLELINRARANPEETLANLGGTLNSGLPFTRSNGQTVDPIEPGPKQPLAWNPLLGEAAQGHSLDMLASDDPALVGSRLGSDGTTPLERIQSAGYGPVQGRSGNSAVYPPLDADTPAARVAKIEQQHMGLLLSAGHRHAMLNDGLKEAGIGAETGIYEPNGTGRKTVMTIQEFAVSDTDAFLTGVAYEDFDRDDLYTPGEGLGGVTVTAHAPDGGMFQATTWASGGYRLELPRGTYSVRFEGRDFEPEKHTVTIGDGNVKLDLELDSPNAGNDQPLYVLSLSPKQQIQAIYIAYFGRAADPAGQKFWLSQRANGIVGGGNPVFPIGPFKDESQTLDDIATSFAADEDPGEARDLFPFLADPQAGAFLEKRAFIDAVYNNLFERDAEPAGQTYWANEIDARLARGEGIGSIILDIISGARNTAAGQDKTTILNKIQAANYYTEAADDAGGDWTLEADRVAAVEAVAPVTADPDTIAAGQTHPGARVRAELDRAAEAAGYTDGTVPALFDPVHYLWELPGHAHIHHGTGIAKVPNPPIQGDPYQHYLQRGIEDGIDPHPMFDVSFYLAENPSVAAAGVDPLLHYLLIGGFEGADPVPGFDSSFYLDAYPEVAEEGINPLVHYLQSGGANGKAPQVDENFYLREHPEVATGELSATEHWLQEGRHKGFEPVPELHEYTFDIASNVPRDEVETIKSGLERAEKFFAGTFGHDLSVAEKHETTVKIVATGDGNTEPGGGGSVATAYSQNNETVPRPFFDVAHDQWQTTPARMWPDLATQHEKVVIHEYAHGIQLSVGALTQHGGPMADWMEEGMAEYLANEAMIAEGLVSRTAVENFQFSASQATGEIDGPLRSLEPDGGHVWPGHVGYLAVAGLVEHAGGDLQNLLTYMEDLALGSSRQAAFAAAFDISIDDFYKEFEVWRTAVRDGEDVDPVWGA